MSSAEFAALEARRAAKFNPAPPSTAVGVKLALVIAPSKDEANLNKLERDWLAYLRLSDFLWVGIQSVTLKLGDDCRYTPDFMCVTHGGELVSYETKGFMRDDAQVKVKTAARQFPWIKFSVVRRLKGQWDITEIRG